MRVFLAIAILVLGFMIWRLHQDIQQVHEASNEASREVSQLHQEAAKGMAGVGAAMKVTSDKIDKIELAIKKRKSMGKRKSGNSHPKYPTTF